MIRESGTTLKGRFPSKLGQTLVIIIMIMAFSLVTGLAISSRVIIALRQVSYATQSAEALSFAEAGIEYALGCLKGGPCSPGESGSLDVDEDGDNDCDYTIAALSAGSYFSSEDFGSLKRDEVVQIDLNGYATGGTVYISWVDRNSPEEDNPCASPSDDADCPAMEVSLVYEEGGDYKLLRRAWDPVGVRRASNNFDTPGSLGYLIGGVFYRYRVSVTSPGAPKLLRLKPFYTDIPTSFAVSAAAGNLPAQGVKVESTGHSGKVQRKIEATRSAAVLPALFDYVLFSGSELEALTK